MEDSLKKFFFKERDVEKKLRKYNLDDLFSKGLNNQVNIIISKLLDNNMVDKDLLVSKVIKSMKKVDDIITLAICLREGCVVRDVNDISDKDLRVTCKELIDVSNGKRNIGGSKLFLYNILLNRDEVFTDINDDDYYNIISSGSSLFNIKSKNVNLLKQACRCYNYERFIEFINNGVFPDYVMVNDIIINISVTSGVPRYELIRMIKYLIYNNIKLDSYQCEILLSRNKTNYVRSNSLIIKDTDRQIQNLYNNDDIIFSLNFKERVSIKGLIYQEPVIISDKLLDIIINRAESIMLEVAGEKPSKRPVYTYSSGVNLSDDHSYITLCRIIINCYKNDNKNRIIEIIKDIS